MEGKGSYLENVVQPGQAVNPLLAHLGIVVSRLDAEAAVLSTVVTPALLQGAGVLAGGVIATLLDEAMAHAALGRLGMLRIATVEMSVRYFSPVQLGDAVEAKAWMQREGSRLLTLEAELLRNARTLAAKAVATFIRV
ncbi:PaaI family thioesterase [Megalodesulfovibrio paquesii]